MLDQAQLLRNYLDGKKEQAEIPKEAEKKARIITVTSGKGGVGKSNFSVNFAIELSKNGKNVLIIDADFGLSNIDVIFGITPRYDLSDVLKRSKRMVDVITEGPYGVKFISGGSGELDLLSLDDEGLDFFLDEMNDLEKNVDFIIFDTGAGINDNFLKLMQASDEVVLVMTPEPPAIVDAYALFKTLISVDKSARIRLAMNKVESSSESNKIIENFRHVTMNYLKCDFDELGFIVNDSSVVKAVKKQQPFTICYPNCTASKNISDMATKFLSISEKKNKLSFKLFFKNIIKR